MVERSSRLRKLHTTSCWARVPLTTSSLNSKPSGPIRQGTPTLSTWVTMLVVQLFLKIHVRFSPHMQ